VVVVAAGEPEVVDDGLEALRAPPDEAGVAVGDVDEGVDVDDGLEGLRGRPASIRFGTRCFALTCLG